MGGQKTPLKRLPEKVATRLRNIRELPETPLWKGPLEDGITQSMLGSFLVCPERFCIKVIKGLKPQEGFSHRLEYGNMWHICEEHFAAHSDWELPLKDYAVRLSLEYPNDRYEIEKWWNVCKVAFPVYVDYWSKHRDVKQRTPIFQEEVFRIEYVLPSQRIITLRGKFDGVDLIGKREIYLMEHKTKAEIEEQKLKQELPNTLQPMFYLTALALDSRVTSAIAEGCHIAGVRYNVARRPLGGGKHSISQHKGRKTKKGLVGAETKQMFYTRLGGLIEENANHFFMRWKCDLTPQDMTKFQDEVLHPILENLVDWYEWMEFCCHNDESRFNSDLRNEQFPHHVHRHFRLPYGLYNPLLEGRNDEWNQYITNGTMTGMMRVERLFPELSEEEI